MTKIYLKFVFGFILIYYLSLGHTSDWVNYDYHEIYPQVIETRKRILDDQDISRVTKKQKTEVTQILNFEQEVKNSEIKYFFSSSLSSSEGFSAFTNDLLEQKNKIKITDLNNHAVSKIFIGQYEEARQDCNSALAMPGISNNEKALTLIRCSFIEINLNEFTAAIKNCDQVLEIVKISNKNKALAFINRGFAKSNLGLHEAAIFDYDQALKIKKINNIAKIITLNNRAFAKNVLGHYEAAILDYDQVLMIPKIDKARKALAFINRGYVKSGLGQYKAAIIDLEEALKFENIFSHQQLSIFYRKLDLLYKVV